MSLKTFFFGKWKCTHTGRIECNGSNGLIMIFTNSKTGKQEARIETLTGYKQSISLELAKRFIENA